MLIHTYTNGNATVSIYDDGTRIIESPDDKLNLEFPLNIDIRLSEQCSFGFNPKTNKAICSFCHESARTDGRNATVEQVGKLIGLLSPLPRGVELAVGANQITDGLRYLLRASAERGWIVNLTVNQGHIRRDGEILRQLIDEKLIRGLGISFRPGMGTISRDLLDYENTVVHVIAGIDTLASVKALATRVKKILILGEKDFGFNKGKVQIVSDSHRQWYRGHHELFKLFKVVSFDNLALEQLNTRRFIIDWDTLYQHEYSFYINAVKQYFSRSSRSEQQVSYVDDPTVTLDSYWRSIISE